MIGFNLPSGQYIAAQAIEDDPSWAMQVSKVREEEAYNLYNKRGEIIGTLPLDPGAAASEFFSAVTAAILAYNGQSVFFEPNDELVLPDDYEIIP